MTRVATCSQTTTKLERHCSSSAPGTSTASTSRQVAFSKEGITVPDRSTESIGGGCRRGGRFPRRACLRRLGGTMRAGGDDTPTLPEYPAALRALLLAARAERDALASRCDDVTAERHALASRNEQLQHLLLKLKRRQFGRKSEQLPEEQLLFAFEEIEATLAANAAESGKKSPALRDQQAKRRRAG